MDFISKKRAHPRASLFIRDFPKSAYQSTLGVPKPHISTALHECQRIFPNNNSRLWGDLLLETMAVRQFSQEKDADSSPKCDLCAILLNWHMKCGLMLMDLSGTRREAKRLRALWAFCPKDDNAVVRKEEFRGRPKMEATIVPIGFAPADCGESAVGTRSPTPF